MLCVACFMNFVPTHTHSIACWFVAIPQSMLLLLFLILFVISFIRSLSLYLTLNTLFTLNHTVSARTLYVLFSFATDSDISIGFQAQQQPTNRINAIGACCMCTNAILSLCVLFRNPPISYSLHSTRSVAFAPLPIFHHLARSQFIRFAFVCVCPL